MTPSEPHDQVIGLPLSGVHLVEASAGTGKTFTLTAWLLRLLLESGVPLRELLVVTFTRAATAQLRDRVRRRLRSAEQVLAGEHPSGAEAEQTQQLIALALTRAVDEPTLRLRLQAALLQLDEASISTIHGFCQRALQEFGFLAGGLEVGAIIDDANQIWRDTAADLWRIASDGSSNEFNWLRTLWKGPQALALDLPKLSDPARDLLPEVDASSDPEVSAWLHRLRAAAGQRFAILLAQRQQCTQDQLIERAWRASESAQFAAALKRRWPIIFVDEFQDTDPRQWELLQRIHTAQSSASVAAGLFLIGDPKQAIYRFRGGDLPTYLHARDYARRHGSESTLQVNHRSSPALLRGIDALFQQNPAPFVEPGIEFVQVTAAESNHEARLQIDGEAQPGVVVHWLPPDKKQSNSVSKTLSVQVIVNEIVRMLAAGVICDHDGERAMRAEDIAVLVRTNQQAEEIRAALVRAGVAAAILGGRSVFASAAAAELLRLMRACAAPSDPGRIRAALATRLLGANAVAIAALAQTTEAHQTPECASQTHQQEQLAADALPQQQTRFEQAAAMWMRQGPLPALLPLLSGNASRLLTQAGGARLLADALHLAELAQMQFPLRHGITGLLRWFERECAGGEMGDDAALRMESDAQAVQIMTLHKSKGLEFPVVFLPFTAFAVGAGSHDGDVQEHVLSNNGRPAIYFHAPKNTIALRSSRHEALLADQARDELGDHLRLFYVGLTRARLAVHLTGGCSRTLDFNAAPLRWLLCAEQTAGSDKKKRQIKTSVLLDTMLAQLETLAAASNGGLQLRKTPVDLAALTLHTAEPDTPPPPARHARQRLPRAGAQHSFSSLRGQHRETLPARGAEDEIAGIGDDGRTALAGAAFGNVVHEVLETADFSAWAGVSSAPDHARVAIARALKRHAIVQSSAAITQVGDLVARALNVPLPGAGTLAQLPASRRVAELEFHFRLASTDVSALYALLDAHGYSRAATARRGSRIEGLMHGYIDMVYRDDNGAVHVLDYKTNQLHSYAADACKAAVAANDYDLQYLIYLVAVQRWLRLRLGADYHPARHLGGAVYLFLRGIDLHARSFSDPVHGMPVNSMPVNSRLADSMPMNSLPTNSMPINGVPINGVHIDRPAQALIDQLDALFAAGAT